MQRANADATLAPIPRLRGGRGLGETGARVRAIAGAAGVREGGGAAARRDLRRERAGVAVVLAGAGGVAGVVVGGEEGAADGVDVGGVALQTGDVLAVGADGPAVLVGGGIEVAAGVGVEEAVCGDGGGTQEGGLRLRREGRGGEEGGG